MTVSRRLLLLVILGGFALVLALPALVGLGANWLWFSEVGYEVVYGTRLATGGLLFLLVGRRTGLRRAGHSLALDRGEC